MFLVAYFTSHYPGLSLLVINSLNIFKSSLSLSQLMNRSLNFLSSLQLWGGVSERLLWVLGIWPASDLNCWSFHGSMILAVNQKS